MIEEYDATSARDLLDQVGALRIILVLDFLVVREAGVLRRVAEELQAVLVQRHRALAATQILDLHIVVCTPKVHSARRRVRVNGHVGS